jgi:hypothetical protein
MRRAPGLQNLVFGLLLVGTIGCGGKGPNAGDGSAGAGGTVAADGGGGSASCPAGAETCTCYGNSTCNAGLSCFSHLCVRVPSDGGAGAGGTSGSGGASGANGSGGTRGVLDAGATLCREQQTCGAAGDLCVAPCGTGEGTKTNTAASCVCLGILGGSDLEYACGAVSCPDASAALAACSSAVAEGVSCTGDGDSVCATPCVGNTRSECACTHLGVDAKDGGQWLCATGVACN